MPGPTPTQTPYFTPTPTPTPFSVPSDPYWWMRWTAPYTQGNFGGAPQPVFPYLPNYQLQNMQSPAPPASPAPLSLYDYANATRQGLIDAGKRMQVFPAQMGSPLPPGFFGQETAGQPTNPLAPIQNPWAQLQNWGQGAAKAASLGLQAKTAGVGGKGAVLGDTWVDAAGNKRSRDYRIDYAYQNIDARVGKGFTDQFMQLHGVDPLSFYMRAFENDPLANGWQLPGEQWDQARDWLKKRAADAAVTDAKFLPGAVAEWQRIHGNAEIPQEQWERWWKISQATSGYPISGGAGVNPYGVY